MCTVRTEEENVVVRIQTREISFAYARFLSLPLSCPFILPLAKGAAVGHPIVRDTVYGYRGSAAPNGGLLVRDDDGDASKWLLQPNRDGAAAGCSTELQEALAEAAADSAMCVHAKLIRFRHPTTGEDVEFTSAPSF